MIPINYLSRHETAAIIAAAKFAGIPDQPAVLEARLNGVDAADGSAIDDANTELWKAVDKGTLDVYVHGPGDRWLRMTASETKHVPLLRAPRGGDLTFLRPENPIHAIVVSQFGPRLGLVSLVFPKDQVEKLARLVRRRRRRTLAIGAANNKSGRPSRLDVLRPIVRKLVEDGQWNPTMPLIALARDVGRSTKWDKVPSEDTVTRTLDQIFKETQDRRFARVRRKVRSTPAP